MKTKTICLGIALLCGFVCLAQDVINDLDAQDYIYRANIIDPKEKTAIIKLVRALKYYRIWDDIHAIYLPTGGTELSHSLNLKDPSKDEDAYPLVFPKGATHTNAGVSFNGVDQGAISLYRAVSTRLHLMVYQSQPTTQPFIWSGDREALTDYASYSWSALYTDGVVGFANTSGANFQQTNVETGFFYGQRINHDSTEGYVNGERVTAWPASVTPYYNTDTSQFIWLNKTNQLADFSDATTYSVSSIGNLMDSAKVSTYYHVIQAFLSELGIQVGESTEWPTVPDYFETNITSNYRWHKATENAVDTAIDGVHLYSIGDSLYLWGGWNGYSYPFDFNTGYVSGDGGGSWQKIGAAPWNIRHSAAYGQDSVGRGYLIGSDAMPETIPENRKEVWRTRTGRNWRLRTNSAPWSANLILHGLAIKGNTLYIGGGQFGTNISAGLNDTIWKSDDGGATWAAINNNASHLGGILYNNFKFFKARNKFVAFCGGKYDNDPSQRVFSSQLWVSDDCINWTREKDVPFEPRMYSDMVEWDNKLWVFGGDRPGSTGNGSINLRGLWYMDVDGEWHEQGSTPLPPRHASGLVVDKKNDRLVIACGNLHTDVWYLEKLPKGPTFTLPLAKNIPVSNDCSLIVPDLSGVVKTDSLANTIQITQSPAPGTILPGDKSVAVSLTAKNLAGVETTQSITLIPVDTMPPVFSVQDSVLLYLNSEGKIVVPDISDTTKGTDNCGTVSFYQLPSAGSAIDSIDALKNIEVVGADERDNMTSRFVVVKIKDTIPPLFAVPDTLSIALDSLCNLTVPDVVDSLRVHDNFGRATTAQAPAAGAVLANNGNKFLDLRVTAIDYFNNITSHTVVIKILDTIPPKMSRPAPRSVFIGSNCEVVVPDLVDSMVVEDCNKVSLEQTPKAGTVLNASLVSEFGITIKATDESQNTLYYTVPITIKDTIAPVFSIINDLKVSANTKQCSAVISIDPPGVLDNCRTTVTGSRNDNQPLQAPFPVGTTTITWKAVDAAGNTVTGAQSITVVDDIPPSVSVPGHINYCYDQRNTYAIPVAIANDNCGIAGVSFIIKGATNRSGNSNNASGRFGIGVSTIIWTVRDINGNELNDSTVVNISQPLEIGIPDIYTYVEKADPNTLFLGYGPSSVTITPTITGGMAPYTFSWSNNMQTESVNFSPTSEGVVNFSVFAEDAAGCMDSASLQIKVIDIRCANGVLVCRKEMDQTFTDCVDSSMVASLLQNGAYLGSCRNSGRVISSNDSLVISTIPNPSTYSFNLLVQTEKTGPVSVRIFNSLGQLLDERHLTSDYVSMNFGKNYVPGIYFAEITSGSHRKVVKLIKNLN